MPGAAESADLDTCRFNPSKGQERPGSGPMGAKLDAMLQDPPMGVQVWSACVAEQFSYEFEDGTINNGLFLEALFDVVVNINGGKIQTRRLAPAGAVGGSGQRPHETGVGAAGKVQTSRLTGTEVEGGAPPNAGEPLPEPKVVNAPPRPGGTADLSWCAASSRTSRSRR